VINITICF